MTLRMQESGLQELDFSNIPGEIYPRISPLDTKASGACTHPSKILAMVLVFTKAL